MSDPAGKIGGQFSERLTQLYESVREAGTQETLGTVRSLAQELGSDGVDGFIGSFQSIAGEEKAFLKNLFDGRVSDPAAAAAGAKSLLTREIEGQLQHRRLEAHVQGAVGHTKDERLHINPQPEPPGGFVLPEKAATAKSAHHLVTELEKRTLGPQPEPPDNAMPRKTVPGMIGGKLSVELEKRHFDPQPEPPGILQRPDASSTTTGQDLLADISSRGFNPQPEPPATGLIQQPQEKKTGG